MDGSGTVQERASENEFHSQQGATDSSNDGIQPSSSTKNVKRKRPKQKISIFAKLFIIFVLVMSLSIIIFMFTSGISIFAVKGNSMNPTLHNGDSIIIKQRNTVKDKQIVVFHKPSSWPKNSLDEGDDLLIKRIIAIPGDTLSFDGTIFKVNGKEIARYENGTCDSAPKNYSYTLNSKQIAVKGDNTYNSLDSLRVFCSGKINTIFIDKMKVVDNGVLALKF